MSSDSPLPASLQQPLQLLADEYSQEVPPEVYRVFPEWRTELQSILLTQNEVQLRAAIAGLDAEAAVADGSAADSYQFAKRALLAALNVHDAWGRAKAAGASVPATRGNLRTRARTHRPGGWGAAGPFPPLPPQPPSPRTLPFSAPPLFVAVPLSPLAPPSHTPDTRFTSLLCAGTAAATFAADFGTFLPKEGAKVDLISQLLAIAPSGVRESFPDFDNELRSMLTRPEAELRVTVQRLEAALADLEVRCFTDSYPDPATHLEAEALAFGVRALHAVIHGVDAEAPPPPPSEQQQRAGAESQQPAPAAAAPAAKRRTPKRESPLEFAFRGLEQAPRAPSPPPNGLGDAFNPCCAVADTPTLTLHWPEKQPKLPSSLYQIQAPPAVDELEEEMERTTSWGSTAGPATGVRASLVDTGDSGRLEWGYGPGADDDPMDDTEPWPAVYWSWGSVGI